MHADRVTVSGAPATNVARLVDPGEPVRVIEPPAPFVSRAGLKLDGALDHFGVDVVGRRAVDVGSSTGGFTDCLLQRGAGQVVAVDVGYGLLHEHLLADPRVIVRERTNVRRVSAEALGAPFDVVVADLSFISLRTVAGALRDLLGPGGDLVVLVKPQFEAERAEADRGQGVIDDPDIWRRAVHDVGDALAGPETVIMDAMVSPLRGTDGNVEFFLHLGKGTGADRSALDIDALLAGVERQG